MIKGSQSDISIHFEFLSSQHVNLTPSYLFLIHPSSHLRSSSTSFLIPQDSTFYLLKSSSIILIDSLSSFPQYMQFPNPSLCLHFEFYPSMYASSKNYNVVIIHNLVPRSPPYTSNSQMRHQYHL